VNWKTFYALLARDGHIARRNVITMLVQILLQPLLFSFVFGRVLTMGGLMRVGFKSVLLPGVMATSMVITGIQAVAMPLVSEFQFSREIEDRLLAPMENAWLAVEKIVAGLIQSVAAGLLAIPAAWLMMGPGAVVSYAHPFEFAGFILLVSLLAASLGLALGCSVPQTHIGLMFGVIMMPVMVLGCVYYPWSFLRPFPELQYVVLINPVVYATEGLRGVMVPQIPHLPGLISAGALVLADTILVTIGIKRFCRKAVS
jgi:ABC-2 type transport system permease protein